MFSPQLTIRVPLNHKVAVGYGIAMHGGFWGECHAQEKRWFGSDGLEKLSNTTVGG
jgi:hypothetical protein